MANKIFKGLRFIATHFLHPRSVRTPGSSGAYATQSAWPAAKALEVAPGAASWPESHWVPTLGFDTARPRASQSSILYPLNRMFPYEAFPCTNCQASFAIV